MRLVNDYLTEEEYRILSCSKENWQKNKHTDFISILKKYIDLSGTGSIIYLESISFPDIYFNHKLLGNSGICIQKCIFYGKVYFTDLICQKNVNINHCEFMDEVVYKNITFQNEVQMFWNTYNQNVIFQDGLFK